MPNSMILQNDINRKTISMKNHEIGTHTGNIVKKYEF